MTLASGVEFFEKEHEYYYKGKKLSGITGLISKKLGYKYVDALVQEHQVEGSHIHKSVSEYINTGMQTSEHPSVEWVITTLPYGKKIYSEVLVSDFEKYASAIDVMILQDDGTYGIYDIKKGLFHRDYVSLQLGVYKYFAETFGNIKVSKCGCICCKDKEWYDIFPRPEKEVLELLYKK